MVVITKMAVSLLGLAWACLIPAVSAGAFLRQHSHAELQRVTREIIEGTLMSELAMDSDRVSQFEDELRSMYVSLPKNEHGSLDPPAVRYALHRYFVQKHGWYVKGLEPAGQAWNSSAPTSITTSRVPAYIQSLFEQRLHGRGLGLHELAVFAATLSDFVHNEALGDVMDLYETFGLPSTSSVRPQDADRVIKAYTLQILDGTTAITSMQTLRDLEAMMLMDFPAWGDFKLWVQDVRQTMTMERSRQSLFAEDFTLEHVIREVQEITDRLGVFQNIECKHLKGALADIEYKSTGRVPLADFYREGKKGEFLFTEQAEYLRRLGALDESDPQHPSVIIVNYLAGQANCLASTGFHSVCCFDECEPLLGQLERSIAAPSAPPARIAELVRGLNSDTIDAPRTLPSSLLSRLDEIADHHDGQVPLHGRLFAQWMHHAFPLECPYPHVAGVASALTPDEYMDVSGTDDIAAPEHEQQRYMNLDMPQDKSDELPWTAVEELVVARRNTEKRNPVRQIAALALVLSFAVPLVKLFTAFASPSTTKCETNHQMV